MPKSRPRRVAAEKMRRARRIQAGPAAVEQHRFTRAPWRAWRECRERYPADPAPAKILAALPYLLAFDGPPVPVSLQQLADDEELPVADVAEGLMLLEKLGALVWDGAAQTARAAAPPQFTMECGHPFPLPDVPLPDDSCDVCLATVDRLTGENPK
ncbi:hypothetical protein [Nonomuraea sp. NPDC052265]|uniref:hypothetical protein n=1 Tax=Nonomuraea sp. NPDC052265 TaxID=3364374 RepID=UPI0037C53A84